MTGRRFAYTPVQEDFDRFAEISGDDNPIHVDPAFAARTRFGKTVAHGMYLYALLSPLGERLSQGRRITESQLMFPAPARVNETLIFEAQVADGDTIVLTATRQEGGDCVCHLMLSLGTGADDS